jgi:putative transposase
LRRCCCLQVRGVINNGTELMACAYCAGARRCRSIALHRAGKPTQNAFIERFNVRQRDELLNETLFTSLAHVRALLAAWKNDYNDVRPNETRSHLTPAEHADRSALETQRDETLRYASGSAPRPVAPPSPFWLACRRFST